MPEPQPKKVARFLAGHAGEMFTAREIAENLIALYPEEYARKRRNPRFADDNAFLSQVAAEIGAHKNDIIKNDPAVTWQDFPKPRRYYVPADISGENQPPALTAQRLQSSPEEVFDSTSTHLREEDLYPLLMQYLSSEQQLYCMRIRENTSGNSLGQGGNHWLHPDIVAMQPLDKDWGKEVRDCLRESGSTNVRLWSFEVKKELNVSNLRQSFFQAVSNSSWANEGYLVATSLGRNTEQELRMLSALHGIGVIVLNPETPSESAIILPASQRPEVDWQSVNRLSQENRDFRTFIEQVLVYYKTGNLERPGWNR